MGVSWFVRGVCTGILSAMLFAAGAWAETPAGPRKAADKPKGRQLAVSTKPWTGDFDGMLERRVIRVLVPYSRSLYFNDKGRERGLTADNVRDFERWINKKYAKQLGKRPVTVYIIPATRDRMLPEVASGLGDIAVGNLTVTEERLKSVDFAVLPDQAGVNEVVVTGPKSPAIAPADDLSGKTVHVRKASSYYESLMALNGRFGKEGKPAVKIVLVPVMEHDGRSTSVKTRILAHQQQMVRVDRETRIELDVHTTAALLQAVTQGHRANCLSRSAKGGSEPALRWNPSPRKRGEGVTAGDG